MEVRPGEVVIRGAGLREARQPEEPIDVGNAGTLLRLLPGWLAAQEGRSFTLDGDASIRRRPVDRIAEPLALMGARLEASERALPALHGARRAPALDLPRAARRQRPGQVLRAARRARRRRRHHRGRARAQSRPHRAACSCAPGVTIHRNGRHVTVVNADELVLEHVAVPGDPSSAAFMIAAGVLVPGSRLLLRDVGVNWTRTGFLRILRACRASCSANWRMRPANCSASEPTSDLDVAAGALEGTVVEPEEVPLAIDELPLVALLGCFAEGETIVRGAQELRLKESDRIATVVEGLRGLGAEIEATEDGFAVTGHAAACAAGASTRTATTAWR